MAVAVTEVGRDLRGPIPNGVRKMKRRETDDIRGRYFGLIYEYIG